MKRKATVLMCLAGVAVLVTLLGGFAAHSARATSSIYDKLSPIQKRLISGFAATELTKTGGAVNSPAPTGFAPAAADPPGCTGNLGSNVKVNQNCLNISDSDLQGRGQSENETAIAVDRLNNNHVVAGYNDYRRGDGTCGTSYSLDGGQTWQDSTMPNGFTRGASFGGVAREYWQAGGDPSVAWDSRGNAYYACQTFMRGTPTTNNPDASSAFYVFRSTGNNGASWNFTGRPVFTNGDPTGTSGILEDKQYLTVDNRSGGSFRDRVYVTWTEFAADGSAYIWESHSNDYGQTFSARVLVSATSPLCVNTFGAGTPNGTCNENQYSQPFTAPDGTLYVTWANFNNTVTGSDNRNQILFAKSTDGGATFSAPVKVSDYYDLPDCPTYQAGQNPGRACVPEKGAATNSVFRATNYPSGAVDPQNGRIAVTFGSYINADSKESNGCTPDGFAGSGNNKFIGVKTAGACSNKILVSVSTNGGASFTGTATDPRSLQIVNTASGQTHTDQWWQWAAFMPQSEVFGTISKLAVSYYDRQYGSDETNGNSDISLSGSIFLSSFTTKRVTSSSMPLPTQFPNGTGNSLFFGDYSGLDTGGTTAHPIWMDTRQLDLFVCPGTAVPGVPPALCNGTEPNGLTANDQDVFTDSLAP